MRFSRVIWQLLQPSLKSNVSQEKCCSDLLSILTSCNRFFKQNTVRSPILQDVSLDYRILLLLRAYRLP